MLLRIRIIPISINMSEDTDFSIPWNLSLSYNYFL